MDGSDIEALLQTGERMLYRAKAEGRNRVVTPVQLVSYHCNHARA